MWKSMCRVGNTVVGVRLWVADNDRVCGQWGVLNV
jgi:hypothetical protein